MGSALFLKICEIKDSKLENEDIFERFQSPKVRGTIVSIYLFIYLPRFLDLVFRMQAKNMKRWLKLMHTKNDV